MKLIRDLIARRRRRAAVERALIGRLGSLVEPLDDRQLRRLLDRHPTTTPREVR